jgi:hypothetical protein
MVAFSKQERKFRMTTEASVRNEESTLEAGRLGAGFIRWGTGLFIFGLIIGYGPLLHYMHGAVEGDIGPAFLKNLTLWFACPWTLAVYFAQIGGIGMIAIGVSFLTFARDGRVSALGTGARRSLGLCIVGVLAEFLTGYPGYFVVAHFWPNFYYAPIEAGKNVWLALQGVSIAPYVAGVIFAFGPIRRASRQY